MVPNAERNYYADHLVEINKTNPVITAQDICNNLGATVIPKGTNITEDVANKISKFKLEIPIELQVNLAVRISPNELFNSIKEMQTKTFGSSSNLTATKELIRQCGLLNAYPLISQKLTVFEERMPVKYSDTQGVAGFALLIALKLGLNSKIVEVIFATAQMHEAGFLNIDPKIALNLDSLTEDEQRVFYKEQLNLGKQFLDQVPSLPKSVGDSVLAHQERKDGSGWPEGIIGDKNSLESQIVGLAVFLHEAFTRKLKPRGFDCAHLIPVIEAQSESFSLDIYHAAVEMLREGAHKTSQVIPSEFMSPLANYLVVFQRTLIHWFELAKTFSFDIDEAQTPALKGEGNNLLQISSLEQLFRNSGVWEIGIRSWLTEIAPNMNSEECTQVELLALLFESILHKLKRLQWSMYESAKKLGPDWLARCDELSVLLYSMPSDHFEAFEKFDCFKS
jgi:HD-GYP domain-containing protein (c-di-GMP phosphodiesterase class II)